MRAVRILFVLSQRKLAEFAMEFRPDQKATLPSTPLPETLPPPPPETQVPPTEKQPWVMLIPLLNVEEAEEEERIEPPVIVRPCVEERPAVVTPPTNVDDAVEVETMERTVVVPVMTALPVTDSGVPGVLVPMPRLPEKTELPLSPTMVVVAVPPI